MRIRVAKSIVGQRAASAVAESSWRAALALPLVAGVALGVALAPNDAYA